MSHGTQAIRRLRQQAHGLIGAILLPLLIVSSLLWATWNSDDRMHNSEAAIVNLDQGATVKGETVRLGQDYAVQLRNQTGPNFTWRYGVSMSEAESGLASGRYAAAVVIPRGFSRALTGTGTSPDESATLLVERSPVTGVSDQLLLGSLSQAATEGLSKGVAKQYVDEIFVATSQVGKDLKSTQAHAEQAATGLEELSTTAREAQRQGDALGSSADRTEQKASDLARQVEKARESSRTTIERGKQAGVEGGNVQGSTSTNKSSVDELGKAAERVTGGVAKAKRGTTKVAEGAKGAGSQADEAAKRAEAVRKQAAANRASAEAYRGKVGDALTHQADVQQALGEVQAQLEGYAENVQVITGAVRKATELAQQPNDPATPQPTSEPRPTATVTVTEPAEPQPTATVTVTEPAKPQPTATVTVTADPGQTTGPDVKQLREAAASLRAAADGLHAGQLAQAALKASATDVADQARQLQVDYTELTKALPTKEVKLNNGVGNDGGVCPAELDKQECRIYKAGYEAGYNAAVAEVNAALRTKGLNQTIGSLVAKSASLQQGMADIQADTTQTIDGLRALAVRLDGMADKATVAKPSQPEGPKAPVTTGPIAAPKKQPTVRPTNQPTASPTTEPTVRPTNQPSHDRPRDEKPGDEAEQPDAPGEADQGNLAEVGAALSDPAVTKAMDELDERASQAEDALGRLRESNAQNQAALTALGPDSAVAKKLTDGSASLEGVAAEQAKTVATLQKTMQQLAQAVDGLGASMGELETESAGLDTGTIQAEQGAAALAEQVTQLNDTLDGLQSAAQDTADQASATGTQAESLQEQVSALQQAGTTVATTVTRISEQANGQSVAVSKVASRIAKSAEQVPSADAGERQRLSDIIDAPIATTSSSPNRNLGWTAMLLMLGQWAGAMALFAFRPLVSRRAQLSSEPSAKLLAREMAPTAVLAVVQGTVLAGIAQLAVDLPVGRASALWLALVVSSLAAVAVNHSLRSFLGSLGMVISAGFLILTGASLVTAAYPETMDALRKLAPTTPMLDAMRAAMTGAHGLQGSLWRVAAWLAAGSLFSALAILRARTGPELRVASVLAERD